jgi:hypothetical protein
MSPEESVKQCWEETTTNENFVKCICVSIVHRTNNENTSLETAIDELMELKFWKRELLLAVKKGANHDFSEDPGEWDRIVYSSDSGPDVLNHALIFSCKHV